jgi:hypothetical protein
MRKSISALLAVAALSSLALAPDALARGGRGGGHGGGFHGGGFHGGGFHGFAVRGGIARGYAFHRHVVFHRGFRYGFVGRPHYWYGHCYRWRRVLTPWGWRLHRVNVCRFHHWPYWYY